MKKIICSISVFFILNQLNATVWNVGNTRTYKKPSAVSGLVQNGDTVLIDAGIYTQDVCLWKAHHLYINGLGGKAHLKSEGKAYGQKAIWVIQGDSTIIENIEFSECKVPDKNGAGIRLEATHLVLRSCYFHNNENGILAGDNINSQIIIEYCEFAFNGYGDGQSHNLYINHVKHLLFQYNYSHDSHVGHLIKSRAYATTIQYNQLSSEAGDGSYEIDLPNGGQAIILGNIIVQGTNSQNSGIISYGLEGLSNPGLQQLVLSQNTLVNEKSTGNFINIDSKTSLLVLFNNIFAGAGQIMSNTPLQVQDIGNTKAKNINSVGFVDPSKLNYKLTSKSSSFNAGKSYFGIQKSWIPIHEYAHPAQKISRDIEFLPEPGAFETHLIHKFLQPVAGTYGRDYIIVNYVNWNDSILSDAYCGDKTYLGHLGTDFVISGFQQMDSSVYIQAVDSGVVTSIKDGFFDRETIADTLKRLGNYVALRHGDKYYTYYGHLKKNSILVKPGDVVYPGQLIGEVGSSGDASDPHLHFELWYDSLYVIDPFEGPCGNVNSFWAQQDPYDTSFQIWRSGLIATLPVLDTLRFRKHDIRNYTLQKDPIVTYWNLQYGLKAGDTSSVLWYNQNKELKFRYDFIQPKNAWFQYFWTYMTIPELGICNSCTAVYMKNSKIIEQKQFSISQINQIANQNKDDRLIISNQQITNLYDHEIVGTIYSISGNLMTTFKLNPNETFDMNHLIIGMYIIKYYTNHHENQIKYLLIH